MKKFLTLSLLAALALPALAQDNLFDGATVETLGEPLTWSNGDISVTFNSDDLSKILNIENKDDVFLYPQNGDINTAENQEKGAQVFYVKMTEVQEIGSIHTTWEGAAADAYNIYVTTDAPTATTLQGEPTYSAKGLGQYTSNTAVMPEGTKGQYVTFQVVNATNWGWGVKIRTIYAYSPQKDELGTFNVSPKIVCFDEATALTVSCLNQLGTDISSKVAITVSDNALYEDGMLTITSGSTATLTASYEDSTLTQVIYAADAPTTPNVDDIVAAIYTNGDTEYNGKIDFQFYNGGATKNGILTFENGATAYSFSKTICIFFTNTETLGTWNSLGIDPEAKGYKTLNLDLYSDADVTAQINFNDGAYTYDISLKAGEWVYVVVPLNELTITINNMSVRIDENDACDILFTNAYFGNGNSTSIQMADSNKHEIVDVVNLQGVVLKKGVKTAEALENLPKGIYIVGGKKIVK